MSSIAVVIAISVLSAFPGEQAFIAGQSAENARNYQQAITYFQQAAQTDPALRPYALVHVAQSRMHAGDRAGAMAGFTEVIQGPVGPWSLMAKAGLAKLLLDGNQSREAVVLLADVLQEPVPWWMEKLANRWAQVLIILPEKEREGFAYYRNVLENTLYTHTRLEAAKMLVRSGRPEDRAVAVAGLIRGGALTDAAVAIFSSTPEIASLNEYLVPQANPSIPLEARVAGLVGNPAQAPWVRLWLAHSLRNVDLQKNPQDANKYSDLLVRYAPGESLAAESLWWLAGKSFDAGNTDQALLQYQAMADTFPGYFRADDALLKVGETHLAAGRVKEALESFTALGTRFPESPFRSRAFYTAGKLQPQLDQTARRFYTQAASERLGDFYAHRALDRLLGTQDSTGKSVNLRMDGQNPVLRPLPGKSQPMAPLPAEVSGDPRVQRLMFFGMNGLEAGEWEALALLRSLNKSAHQEGYYEALGQAGYGHVALQHAIHTKWGIKDGQPSLARLRLEFPRAYWPEVQAVAKRVGLDPYLILAVAKQESTFRSGIQSSAGATGVMQLMPKTAAWLAEKQELITPQHVFNLKSPLNSLMLGAVYLDMMIERSGGNLIYATAAYNGGPGNVDKWLRRFPGYATDEFVEAIPFEETKNYVKRVLGNYAAYHSLYATP